MQKNKCVFINIIYCILFFLGYTVSIGCGPRNIKNHDSSSLEIQVRELLDTASNTDSVVSVKSQQEIIDLCRNTSNGFVTITAIMEQRVLENYDDLLTANLLKEIYLRELKDPSKAVELYEKLVAHDPKNIPLKQELVGIYQASKRYNDVAELYCKEIGKGSGNDEWLQFQVASHLIYAGKVKEGLEYAKERLGKDPSAQNLERMSRLYEISNEWDKAAQEIQKAIITTSNVQYSVNMKIHLGELYIRSQQYEQALLYLKELGASPSLSDQQKSVVNEQIFRVYKKQGRLSELKIEAIGK